MLISLLNDDVLGAFDGICYTLDRDATILAVGAENWNRFAESAGDPVLRAAAVKGQKLFDFIAGDQVQEQIGTVLDQLVSGKATDWVMPYRCDSPDIKRNSRLSIRPIKHEEAVTGFLVQSITLDETQRPPLDIFDFAKMYEVYREEKALPLVSMCSYCQQIKNQFHTGGQWAEADFYYAKGGKSRVRLSHGICPNCKKAVFASLREWDSNRS